MQDRFDGLGNCATGLDDEERDTRRQIRRTLPHQRSVAELEAEWLSSWMAYREVSLLAEALFREGFDSNELRDGRRRGLACCEAEKVFACRVTFHQRAKKLSIYLPGRVCA